jgi:dTDP-4-amino-4,6-dideoxygalactose transaminase
LCAPAGRKFFAIWIGAFLSLFTMKELQLLWLRALSLTRKTARLTRALAHHEISRYPTFLEIFERRYAALTGRQYGLSFCNGTSAIEAALFAANVQPGDEVIVPSCTFHASIDPILNVGATPIFADVDARTLTIDPTEVAHKLSPKTKAVIAVHLWGVPADLQGLRDAIAGQDIVLIEDVSHAHGASYRDRPCGGAHGHGDVPADASRVGHPLPRHSRSVGPVRGR